MSVERDPEHRRDVHVRSAGLCATCGQEQLIRAQVRATFEGGLRIALVDVADCGCGARELGPTQLRTPTAREDP